MILPGKGGEGAGVNLVEKTEMGLNMLEIYCVKYSTSFIKISFNFFLII